MGTVIFDIKYTPYKLKANATEAEQAAHAAQRSFFDMTGKHNIYEYITTEGKIKSEKTQQKNAEQAKTRTMFEYLQKNTGVFNDKGKLDENAVMEMKARLKNNKGNIWHGFISLDESDSVKIDSPEKCIELLHKTFPTFLREMKLQPKDVDLMCALHLDRPHHLHIHFVFWEKAPKFRGEYRKKGRADKQAVQRMKVRIAEYLSDDKIDTYLSRDRAISELKRITYFPQMLHNPEDIQKAMVELAKQLPENGRIQYGSKNFEPYRENVDRIVGMLLCYDKQARDADKRFYASLGEKKKKLDEISKAQKVDPKILVEIETIERDYKARQGNVVLGTVKLIKPEIFERRKDRKYKTSDGPLRRALAISRMKIGKIFRKFLSSFGAMSGIYERDFNDRLQKIEAELEKERQNKQSASKQKDGDIKD